MRTADDCNGAPMGRRRRRTASGFGLPSAAYNPHIFLTEPLAFKSIIQLQIYLNYGYMNINIYRCTFSKNVCMPSGAGFVKTVTAAAPPALLVETKRVCEKGGREHIF